MRRETIAEYICAGLYTTINKVNQCQISYTILLELKSSEIANFFPLMALFEKSTIDISYLYVNDIATILVIPYQRQIFVYV